MLWLLTERGAGEKMGKLLECWRSIAQFLDIGGMVRPGGGESWTGRKMDGPRKDGLYLLLLGCAAFLLLGARWYISPGSMQDFRTAYSSARCLLHGCDPYNPAEVLRDYRAHPGAQPEKLRS